MQKITVRANVRNTNVGKSGYGAAMLRMQMNDHAERQNKTEPWEQQGTAHYRLPARMRVREMDRI